MKSLWSSLVAGGKIPGASLFAKDRSVALSDLARVTFLDTSRETLQGQCILLATRDQLPSALALLELDGHARRIVVCPGDLPLQYLPEIVATAQVDAIAIDSGASVGPDTVSGVRTITVHEQPRALAQPGAEGARAIGAIETEWVLLTSGTTGAPKLVLHTLASLAGHIPAPAVASTPGDAPRTWSTFYDIRRYGGLQIFLRAVLGDSSLVLSDAHESTPDFLARAGQRGVTHISGTPSHWRKALMSGATGRISPVYVRLSGEIADQPVLDGLRSAFAQARIAHAFASTEAGVAFDIDDGRAGFPAGLLDQSPGGAQLKVEDGTLRIRGARNASRYLGAQSAALLSPDGYVDTGDMVELREGRYHFVGRKGGVINVGGLKVFPEEVEAVINAHPGVRMSLVKARKNPITGAVVVADVVLAGDGDSPAPDVMTRSIVESCRNVLAPHKVPAMIRYVASLEVSASGKLVRPGA